MSFPHVVRRNVCWSYWPSVRRVLWCGATLVKLGGIQVYAYSELANLAHGRVPVPLIGRWCNGVMP